MRPATWFASEALSRTMREAFVAKAAAISFTAFAAEIAITPPE
jgi:hypothetical protein